MGNRGCLHDAEQRIRRPFTLPRWIHCILEFKGRRRTVMAPGRYTELFFLDEATALAAGHRPCAECRRADYDRVVALVGMRADAIDERLHAERLDGGARRLHRRRAAELPDGAHASTRSPRTRYARSSAPAIIAPGGSVDGSAR